MRANSELASPARQHASGYTVGELRALAGDACKYCGLSLADGSEVGWHWDRAWRCCDSHAGPDGAEPTWRSLIAELLGADRLASDWHGEEVNRRLDFALPFFQRADTGRSRGWQEPWQHLTDGQRTELAAVVAYVRRLPAPGTPARCLDGRCGFCGVQTATRWWTSPFKRADGSPAPLCAACGDAYDGYGEQLSTVDSAPVRRAVRVAATGYLGSDADVSIPMAIQRPEVGDGTAWSHVEAAGLHRLRLLLWARFNGRYAPDPASRDEALAFVGELEADRRRARAAEVEPEPEPLWGPL